MKKRDLINENILVTLAKMLAAFQIKKKIGDMMDRLPEDPIIKKAAKDLIDADQRMLVATKNFCKRNPDHPKCKENSENK